MAEKFQVHPDDLRQVANRIMKLHEMIDGKHQNVAGNQQHFNDHAGPDQIHEAMKTFLTDESSDAYRDAYKTEFQAISDTYGILVSQLKTLEQACRTTATNYEKHDQDTKSQINNAPLEA